MAEDSRITVAHLARKNIEESSRLRGRLIETVGT